MDPYYQDDQITLYHGDCLENTAWLEADVLVTDPPYGVAYESGWVRDRTRRPIAGDTTLEVRDQALALAKGKPALVFGVWDKPRPAGVKHRLIWSKAPDPGMGDLSMPWGKSDEEIYLIGGGGKVREEPTSSPYPNRTSLPATTIPHQSRWPSWRFS